jgi:hypothetical protein
VKNTSRPESTLSKRHNAINYHAVRESVASGMIRIGKENGETNLADAFTKVLSRNKRNAILLHHLWLRLWPRRATVKTATHG